jgi:hypothetical protein
VIAKGKLPALDVEPGASLEVTLDAALPWLSGAAGQRRVLPDLPLLSAPRHALGAGRL